MVGIGSIVSVGGAGGGGGAGATSGITSINGATGPAITLAGVSGVSVVPSGNVILIGGESVGGTGTVNKYAANFVNLSSGVINHGLGTIDVIVQVRDNGVPGQRPPAELIPDLVVFDDPDNVSLVFNVPQTGRVVVLG